MRASHPAGDPSQSYCHLGLLLVLVPHAYTEGIPPVQYRLLNAVQERPYFGVFYPLGPNCSGLCLLCMTTTVFSDGPQGQVGLQSSVFGSVQSLQWESL